MMLRIACNKAFKMSFSMRLSLLMQQVCIQCIAQVQSPRAYPAITSFFKAEKENGSVLLFF